ncbi:MAG: mechanosensitive ion channel family protein [Gammaproteobacteria bacterium]|nr:MAG: mechanosensitive ion channel family protein [Gammaproteobacteria bacterium]RKZ70921.1 MAG: mechanosensitive ion channel family protein [Gammaproteobacteria bacterium]
MGEIATGLFINLFSAAVVLVAGIWAARLIRKLLVSLMEKKEIEPMLISFAGSITYIALIAFVIIAALGQLGVQTTSFIAIIGAAGLAIGLSLQASLSNFASGVMIIFFRPFKVGDFVEAGGVSGVVEGIQIFSTRMRTGDNKAIIVPNSSITGGNITNYSAKDTRRIDLVFGIGYDDDIKQAKSILADIVKKEKRILKEPETLIAVSELADSSVNFIVRPWVKKEDYSSVRYALTEAVKLRFDKEGISIPYPQQDVHMHQINQHKDAA